MKSPGLTEFPGLMESPGLTNEQGLMTEPGLRNELLGTVARGRRTGRIGRPGVGSGGACPEGRSRRPARGGDGRAGGCGRTALAACAVSRSVALTASVCRDRMTRHLMS